MWLIDELKIIEKLISNELNFNTVEITVDYELLESNNTNQTSCYNTEI